MGATRADLSRCKRLSAHKTKVFTPWLFTGKVCRQHARPQRHTIGYFLVQLYEAHPIITPILEMRNEAQRHEKTLAHCWEGGKLKNSKALYPEVVEDLKAGPGRQGAGGGDVWETVDI